MADSSSVRLLRRLRITLALGLVAILIILVLQPAARSRFVDSLSSLSPQALILATGLFVMMRVLQALALRRALSLSGYAVSLSSSLNLAGLKGFFNLGLSGLGIAAQSARGRMEFLIPIRAMLFANLIQVFCLIIALGGSLLVSTWLFFDKSGLIMPTAFQAIGAGTAAAGAAAIFILLYGDSALGPSPWIQRLRGFELPVIERSAVRVAALRVTFIQLGIVALRVMRVLAIAVAISPGSNIESLLLSVLMADVVGVIPITPGGIGVRELVIGFLGVTAGQYELFLAAAIIDRALAIALNCVHGAIAVWQSGRRAESVQ